MLQLDQTNSFLASCYYIYIYAVFIWVNLSMHVLVILFGSFIPGCLLYI